jgi:hypothetical protein
MIGTHAPKMFNPRLKQSPLRARVISASNSAITSATTNLRRELWALPLNAADMAAERQQRDQAGATAFEPSIPNIADPRLKQVLIPVGDWRKDEYVATSPIASVGLLHEMYQRLKERNLPHYLHTVQPTAAAISNHGEGLLMQGGKVMLMRRGIVETAGKSELRGAAPVVELRARVERMNISAGMMSVGWPAMTAIGGLIHALERELDDDLQFAFAMHHCQWVNGPLHTIPRGGTPNAPLALEGRVRAGQVYGVVTPTPGYARDEISANALISLFVRGVNPQRLAPALRQITRLAGGSVFDPTTTIHHPGDEIEGMSFLLDASAEIERRPSGADALDAALDAYGRDGSWTKRDGWYQSKNGYTLNATGYAWLETPQVRANARSHKHAWSESVFSLVTQGSLTDDAWWHRTVTPNGVRWCSATAK